MFDLKITTVRENGLRNSHYEEHHKLGWSDDQIEQDWEQFEEDYRDFLSSQ